MPLLFLFLYIYIFFFSLNKPTNEHANKDERPSLSETIVYGFRVIVPQLPRSIHNQTQIYHCRIVSYSGIFQNTLTRTQICFSPSTPPHPSLLHKQAATKTYQGCSCYSPLFSLVPRHVPPPPPTPMPLVISQEHSGGKVFHLLNKVEGCHSTRV